MDSIFTITTKSVNPYQNLALEEYLLTNAQENECTLYLWQNEKTVVIGRNQNAWKECKINELKAAGGYLARRLSGGGAVFHDLGNLNFTFVTKTKNSDITRQITVIQKAVEQFDICVDKSGRNDLTVGEKKISGNAFYTSGENCYHHGTIMVDVNLDDLTKYLTVSPKKIIAKGIESVRSRVINLAAINPEITIDRLQTEMIRAFGKVYERNPIPLAEPDTLQPLYEKYQAADWNLGKQQPFTWQAEDRFAWGEIWIRLNIVSGIIQNADCFSDALHADAIADIPKLLIGLPFEEKAIQTKLSLLSDHEMGKDITHLLLHS